MELFFTDKLSKKVFNEFKKSLFYISFLKFPLTLKERPDFAEINFRPNYEYIKSCDNDTLISIIKSSTNFFRSLEKMADKHIKSKKKDLKPFYIPNIKAKLEQIKDISEKYEYIKSIYEDKVAKLKIHQISEYLYKEAFNGNHYGIGLSINIAKYWNNK